MIRRFVSVVLAMMLLSGIALFAACAPDDGENGDGINWAEMIYPDYHALYAEEVAPENWDSSKYYSEKWAGDHYFDYWETKTIKWQFVNDKTGAQNHGFANYFPTLFNLYEDGSVKAWQRCTLIPSMFDYLPGATEEEDAYNETGKVCELFYGYWELDESTKMVTVKTQNSFDYSADGDAIIYSTVTFDSNPNGDGKISFYFNVTEKGQAIKSLLTCDTNYTGTIQYNSYANMVNSVKNELPA